MILRARQIGTVPHPHTVADAAARIARRHLHPRWRPLVLATLAPHWPPEDERDDRGAHIPATLARWAQTLVHVREPADIGEIVMPPWRTIALGAGDCDDAAAAVAWMAAMMGLRASVAVYRTGARDAHMVAVVSPDSYRATLAHIIDHRTGLRPWPPMVGDRAVTARLFVVRR